MRNHESNFKVFDQSNIFYQHTQLEPTLLLQAYKRWHCELNLIIFGEHSDTKKGGVFFLS